jgi:hypothetical protein
MSFICSGPWSALLCVERFSEKRCLSLSDLRVKGDGDAPE